MLCYVLFKVLFFILQPHAIHVWMSLRNKVETSIAVAVPSINLWITYSKCKLIIDSTFISAQVLSVSSPVSNHTAYYITDLLKHLLLILNFNIGTNFAWLLRVILNENQLAKKFTNLSNPTFLRKCVCQYFSTLLSANLCCPRPLIYILFLLLLLRKKPTQLLKPTNNYWQPTAPKVSAFSSVGILQGAFILTSL